ncbi:ABC transporter ATP-binding protein [Kocuria coralli]|uniref:ABC transporter ATP-binding protein n=1 Tax=Kocuria coralli TaxID=1461025 RepID=A0A5J5L0M8_9MICC|nr:ABC transporter ATP-binding protein [Kocuria coralli]KAA9395412.1 ABC transporter ATP-binding protein [Kocuria coralli]
MSDPVFETRGLSLGYGPRIAVSEVDLAISPGETTVLIGANGSGKSTLFKGLSRQLAPSTGTIRFNGHDLEELRPKPYARQVALLPQAPLVPEGLTVTELVSRGRHPHRRWWGAPSPGDDEAIARALSMVSLEEFAERPVDELSGGQRQRVWIALVLAQDTPTVLLDEPTAALDLAHQVELLDLLRGLRRPDGSRTTVITVLHELNLAARVADRVIALNAGRISAAGTPEEVFTPEILAEVFDLEAQVVRDPVEGHPVILPRGRRRICPTAPSRVM